MSEYPDKFSKPLVLFTVRIGEGPCASSGAWHAESQTPENAKRGT